MALSPLSYHVERFGNEREPVVVIDNFSESLERLKQRAFKADFKAGAAYYPGVQAPEDPNYLSLRGRELTEIFSNIFNNNSPLRIESCVYSIVCAPPGKLLAGQCLPHYDGFETALFASVHYIQGPASAGTAFYRHKRTGFETVSEGRNETYRMALKQDISEFGLPPNHYFYGDDERYEMIGEIKAEPDRLILYRGYTLHSGCISSDVLLNPNPPTARLTLNSFLIA